MRSENVVDNKVVVFKIDNEEFAVSIIQVERILGYTEPTKIPESPDFIKGVITYQDEILPIMDLKKKFNLSDTKLKDNPKIVVVKSEDKKVGLIVDLVSEVMNVDDSMIEEAPSIVKGISNEYISGMIKLNDRIIILIDTEKILTNDEMSKIQSLNI
ncbi:MAG TPA: chemotaxis protein CheW [Clostridiaceae bacterium]|jgi:purine-binding chemotaxis protein CheW|nr:chemotaxis protein CheW [Clostridiaceae bacterium]HBN27700.1 chemotaxis protein CheW [Clostridiaceae bacterium]HBX49006.1 chemotaxis protein CheW [Clostridiaceae bacterium]